MHPNKLPVPLCCAIALLSLAACGGGGGSATIGGTVTGLGNGLTLTLEDNGASAFSITGSSTVTAYTFNFTQTVGSNQAYDVTVVNPPPLGQTCTVTNGSGTVDNAGDAVNNVQISCATTSSVSVTLSGLNAGGGVVLQLTDTTNGTTVAAEQINTALNGAFAFEPLLPTGDSYTVSVYHQPTGQTCTVAAPASGTVQANTTANVLVSCQ